MGILGDGAALVENLVPTGLITAAGKLAEAPLGLADVATRLVEALAINSITEETRRGRRVIVKRRNLHSQQLADLTNLYFRMADIPIRFWSKVQDWQRWEVDCFEMLNGDRFHAHNSGQRTVIADKLPGESLWEHLNRGTLSSRMLRAAAAEFRRAHQFWSDEFRGRWSHGDGTSQNVIYDPGTNRARLIDFEGDGEVIAQLRKQLDLPGGLAWIWWGVRTNFTNPAKVKRRLANLRRAIAKLKFYDAAGSVGRSKRRPSITCHVTKPGMPKASSRTRAIKERAKALGPSIPRRLPIST